MDIIDVLKLAANLEPALEKLVPLVEKRLGGTELNDADLEALDGVAQDINAKVEAKAAEIAARPEA